MEQTTEKDQLELFSPAAALRAQIRSGYKSTDYALAEIIDNSIEAKAKHIDVYVVQGYVPPENPGEGSRGRQGILRIITVDDGCGIEPSTLSRVLTFGYGTHLDQTDGIIDGYGKLGKFGYGLPNASVCTADDIRVWSWKESVDRAFHTGLDVDAVIHHRAKSQTPAIQAPLPHDIRNLVRAAGFQLGASGTIIDWNKVVRTNWKRPSTLIGHVEETVGRIFRHFICNKDVKIRIFIFSESAKVLKEQSVRVNDPLFLMNGSLADSLLKPEDRGNPIFEPERVKHSPQANKRIFWSDGDAQYIDVPLKNGKTARVTIRYSVCTQLARDYGGSSELGKLAFRNSGVSICRGSRELSLSPSWIPSQDPTERWWGCEIDFPPALDDMFGVTNNKQSAPNLDAFAAVDPDAFIAEYRESLDATEQEKIGGFEDVANDMRANGEADWLSFLIRYFVYKKTREMMKHVKVLGNSVPVRAPAGTGGNAPKPAPGKYGKAAGIATIAHPVPYNQGGEEPTADDLTPPDASEKTKQDILNWLQTDYSACFSSDDLDEDVLFTHMSKRDRDLIVLNESHPVYQKLFGNLDMVLDKNVDGEPLAKPLTEEQIEVKMDEVRTSLALLIYSMVKAQEKSGVELKLLRRYLTRVGEELNNLMTEFNEDLKVNGNTGGAEKEFHSV